MSKNQVYNPYLPSFEYIPDGEPHVFGERLYIYGSHDRFDGAHYCLNDYVCYSADITDLTNWKYEGVIYKSEQDPRNLAPQTAPPPNPPADVVPKGPKALNPLGMHAMWAPDVVKGLDGKYYLYYCLDVLPEIGVAVCDTPAGAYQYMGLVKHPDGVPLGQKADDLIQFDPGILIDEDQSIYLYSGNAPMHADIINQKKGSQVMQLEADMLTLRVKPKALLPDLHQGAGTGFEGHEFFEASSIRKINGTYYFIYSSVLSHELCYARSDKPDSGFKYGGTLIDIGDINLNGRAQAAALNAIGNTHGSIECVNGNWYVFYHRQTNRTMFSRQGLAQPIYFNVDGSIDQVEVTSCGLNQGPLQGTGRYPAYICCQLTGQKGAVESNPTIMKMEYPFLTQDSPDMEPDAAVLQQDQRCPYQYITNIKAGTTIGYKYFAIQSLRQIKMRLRGEGNGKFIISLVPKMKQKEEILIGEVLVPSSDTAWSEIYGNVASPEKGVYALYFTYEGSGAIDFID
ncbi:MAG: family 43 glycosylhydrolase, partial [Lachnospiraceae bacterium]|nr:family 43 glycosylhydrolase [Lachnospiraceae bacterium]